MFWFISLSCGWSPEWRSALWSSVLYTWLKCIDTQSCSRDVGSVCMLRVCAPQTSPFENNGNAPSLIVFFCFFVKYCKAVVQSNQSCTEHVFTLWVFDSMQLLFISKLKHSMMNSVESPVFREWKIIYSGLPQSRVGALSSATQSSTGVDTVHTASTWSLIYLDLVQMKSQIVVPSPRARTAAHLTPTGGSCIGTRTPGALWLAHYIFW